MLCRTEDNGTVVYRCEECGLNHVLNRSCGNRHCPQCQSHKTKLWLERQMGRMLPGHHFMITFTVPEELRDFIRSHQRICYAALFAASSDGHEEALPRPPARGRRPAGLLRRAAHLGPAVAVSSPHPLCCPRRRDLHHRRELAAERRTLLCAGEGALRYLSRQVPRTDEKGGVGSAQIPKRSGKSRGTSTRRRWAKARRASNISRPMSFAWPSPTPHREGGRRQGLLPYKKHGSNRVCGPWIWT